MKSFLLLASAIALAATTAAADPITRTTTIDRPNYEGTRVVVRDRAEGSLTRETDVTRKSDGAVASRDYSRDRSATGVTASGSTTGFAGRTRTFEYDRTRTADGYTSNRNVVNGNGTTVYNRDASVTRSGGTVTRSVDVTRAKGFHGPKAHGRGVGGGRRR